VLRASKASVVLWVALLGFLLNGCVDLTLPEIMIDAGGTADGRLPEPGAQGASCNASGQCTSGNCVDGVCCNAVCNQPCFVCNAADNPGLCTPEPMGVLCGSAACVAEVASGERRCNGAGQCVGSTMSCAPFGCAVNSCRESCTTEGDCASGYVCGGGSCVSGGLVLRWTFDEDGGGMTNDASGNNRSGTPIGNSGSRPAPSTDVAPTTFDNSHSLSFDGTNVQSVILSPIPPSIRITSPEVTMTAWIKPGVTTTDGSAVISLGGDYTLRIFSSEIEWLKRKSIVVGSSFAVAQVPTIAHVDGAWHHLAGTAGSFGSRLYLDGTQIASSTNVEPTMFVGPDQVCVGCQSNATTHAYTGLIDDVRIYERALSTAEIVNLVHGNQ
jgi:hypothetical protein